VKIKKFWGKKVLVAGKPRQYRAKRNFENIDNARQNIGKLPALEK
jgi:hypothetical protein